MTTERAETGSVVLQVEHLSKTYGTGPSATEAIRDLSFTVGRGELVCIVGPSGCGKTTLLRCLSGLLAPSGGSIAVRGTPVTEPINDLALVFQDYSRSLLPWMSVLDNVLLPLRHLDIRPAERRERAKAALAEMGLERFFGHYPWQLSGGMQQRTAIARAIAYRPQILLMDEPFASVDAQTRADLEDLVLRVRDAEGMTILFVTHDVDEAVYLGDRVIALSTSPTVVRSEFAIDLPAQRDQIGTKALPEFSELRTRVLTEVRGASADALAAAGA